MRLIKKITPSIVIYVVMIGVTSFALNRLFNLDWGLAFLIGLICAPLTSIILMLPVLALYALWCANRRYQCPHCKLKKLPMGKVYLDSDASQKEEKSVRFTVAECTNCRHQVHRYSESDIRVVAPDDQYYMLSRNRPRTLLEPTRRYSKEAQLWAGSHFTGPAQPIAAICAGILCEQTGADFSELRADTHFINDMAVFDDFDAVGYAAEIQNEFQIDIPEPELEKMQRLSDLVSYLSEHRKQSAAGAN